MKSGNPTLPQWYAVYTKPRRELAAEQHLSRQGFECFLPRACNPTRKVVRSKPRVEPLFPRYLFVRLALGLDNSAPIRSTQGVVGLVRFGQQTVRVPTPIIEGLLELRDLETGLVKPRFEPFDAGDRVQVFDGPFAGLDAVVDEPCGEKRVMVLLDILGRQSRVAVRPNQVRPAA
ncbi:MAG: transcription antitermination protein RfaH [Lysobacteraceae bacterium]|nr:MAG: transcription antitermination protein RfaH [Xanthomonadaceae bacterium]